MSKKRAFCLFVAVIIAASAVTLSSAAENDIYFTAVNNTLLELTAATMPVKYKSTLYVPWSVFSSKELETSAMYSRGSQTVVVSDKDKTLYFDMSAGTAYDENDRSYSFTAIYTNDTAYLPAYHVAVFFGINYSYIRSEQGHIIRLCRDGYLSDADFAFGAETLMQTRLSSYKASAAAAETPSPTFVPTAAPTPTPVYSEPPQQEQPGADVTVYLAYLGINENSGAVLDTLSAYRCKACFFVTRSQIVEYADTVRRLIAEGHSVGVLFNEDPETEFKETSDALRSAAACRPFLAASSLPLTADKADVFGEGGPVVWGGGVRPASRYEAISAIDRSDGRCCLFFDPKNDFTASLLYYLRSYACRFDRITELTPAE
ncbi:MAG: polysaccharide deacetylase family protein [Oscillospiraceae bacterium]|nr:polysaccharide deacetylase family protein [Oscillospiraceae bacterium]